MVKIIMIFISKLINNEEFIQKLADSYPMRRAARFLVYFYQKHKPTALELKKMPQLGDIKEKLRKIAEELEEKNRKLK